MHAGNVHVIVALKAATLLPPTTTSTPDSTSLTMVLNCNLSETCMLNQRGSTLSNLWKCKKAARASCRAHLHLSRYSSTPGNWLLIAAINM